MSTSVGGVGGQPANTPGSKKTVALQGQTLKQIADKHGLSEKQLLNANKHLKNTKLTAGMEVSIPDSTKGKSTAKRNRTAGSPGKVIDLHPKVSAGRARVDQILGKGPQSPTSSAGGEDQSVNKDFILDLAGKSPDELQGWYDSASESLKKNVQGAFSKIDASKLPANEKSNIQKLGGNLNQLQQKHNQKWATNHYGKMSERDIILELQKKTPDQIIEDLGYLSTGSIEGGDRARQKFTSALEKGMRTRQPGISPSTSYPMISPGDIYQAAARYNGPGAGSVKAQSTIMLYNDYTEAAKGKYPDPDPKFKKIGGKLYSSMMKEVAEDRKGYIRSKLGNAAPTLKRLIGSDPAAFVKGMENTDEVGNKVFPEILTAVARSEYKKDPKKGAEFLGSVLGSTAAKFGKSIADADYKKANAMGNDLGFVLGAAEEAIGNVAKEEKDKIDFGKDVFSFATKIISKVPGGGKIAEITDKVIDEMAKHEKGQVDDWRASINKGFKTLILETFDKNSKYATYPIASPERLIHHEEQDVYTTFYQERYREFKKGY